MLIRGQMHGKHQVSVLDVSFFFVCFKEHVEGGVFEGGVRMSFLFGEACRIGGAHGSSVQTWPAVTTLFVS